MSGEVRVEWNSGPVLEAVKEGGEIGLYASAEAVLRRANRYVPFLTGALRDSGHVSVSHELEAAVSYDTPYAAKLHEHPEYDFKNGRSARWLERATDEGFGEATQVLADELNRRI